MVNHSRNMTERLSANLASRPKRPPEANASVNIAWLGFRAGIRPKFSAAVSIQGPKAEYVNRTPSAPQSAEYRASQRERSSLVSSSVSNRARYQNIPSSSKLKTPAYAQSLWKASAKGGIAVGVAWISAALVVTGIDMRFRPKSKQKGITCLIGICHDYKD